MSETITENLDEDLEAALESVGRQEAFAIARAAGWTTYSPPPKTVWWQIIRQMRADTLTEEGK